MSISADPLIQRIDEYDRLMQGTFQSHTIRTVSIIAISVIMAVANHLYIIPNWVMPLFPTGGNIPYLISSALFSSLIVYKIFSYVYFLGELAGKRLYSWVVRDFVRYNSFA